MLNRPTTDIDLADADLLKEIEQSTPDAVKRAREHTRLSVRVKTIVRPGNMSDRLTMKLQGVTGDISAGGCQLLVPLPLHVGDIYWLSFDRASLDVAPVYARCMRCRVVREDAYEAGFAFFAPVDLEAAAGVGAGVEASDSLI